MNEYYIFEAEFINILQSNNIVEEANGVRWNNDKTKFVCKTLAGLKNVFPGAFTHEQIIIELTAQEWQPIEEI